MSGLASDTKTSLKAELKIIPVAGWVVVGFVALVWFTLVMPLLIQHEQQRAPPELPVIALTGLLTFAGIVLTIWVLLVIYVNADAGRRQMSRTLWTLLVLFIPNAIGFIVYFLLRKPIARPCGHCGQTVRPEFTFCPSCGQSVSPTCRACQRGVEAGWSNCAFCGTKLG